MRKLSNNQGCLTKKWELYTHIAQDTQSKNGKIVFQRRGKRQDQLFYNIPAKAEILQSTVLNSLNAGLFTHIVPMSSVNL